MNLRAAFRWFRSCRRPAARPAQSMRLVSSDENGSRKMPFWTGANRRALRMQKSTVTGSQRFRKRRVPQTRASIGTGASAHLFHARLHYRLAFVVDGKQATARVPRAGTRRRGLRGALRAARTDRGAAHALAGSAPAPLHRSLRAASPGEPSIGRSIGAQTLTG